MSKVRTSQQRKTSNPRDSIGLLQTLSKALHHLLHQGLGDTQRHRVVESSQVTPRRVTRQASHHVTFMGATYTILNPAKSKEPSLRCQGPRPDGPPLFDEPPNHPLQSASTLPSSGTGSSHSKSSTWQRWSFRCQWERTPGAIVRCVWTNGNSEQPGVFCLSYAPTYSPCAPQRQS